MELFTLLYVILGAVFVVVYYFPQAQTWISKAASASTVPSRPKVSSFNAIADKFHSLEEVQEALKVAGLESSNLVIGVDFTKSNEYTGKRTFNGNCMHMISDVKNPYQRVIEIVGKTLEVFDDDKLIPAYGFGDITTRDKRVFPFLPDRPCNQFGEVLSLYKDIAKTVQLSGPTSFAPIIYEAINILREERSYHILVIIADGQVTNERDTINAIVEATKYPLSIVLVGVGDGPWDKMLEFDDELPERAFDNFQFVDFHQIVSRSKTPVELEINFAVAALQEIPDQFKEIKRLRLL